MLERADRLGGLHLSVSTVATVSHPPMLLFIVSADVRRCALVMTSSDPKAGTVQKTLNLRYRVRHLQSKQVRKAKETPPRTNTINACLLLWQPLLTFVMVLLRTGMHCRRPTTHRPGNI